MKKTHPVVLGTRILFLSTCVITLARGAWADVMGQPLAGTYLFAAFCAFLSILITHIPDLAKYKDTMMMPIAMEVTLSIFTFCAVFLGEFLDFYTRFFWWDIMLHFISGIMFTLLGHMLFTSLNRKSEVRSQLNPITTVMFAVCFSLACGVFWEMFEFAMDTFFGMNMQRWQTSMSPAEWNALLNASNASNPGLMNTMIDIVADAFGSLLSIALILPLAKHNNGYQSAQIPTPQLTAEWAAAYATAMPSLQPGNAIAPQSSIESEAAHV